VHVDGVAFRGLARALNDETARTFLISKAAPQFFDEPIRFWGAVREFEAAKKDWRKFGESGALRFARLICSKTNHTVSYTTNRASLLSHALYQSWPKT